MAITFKMTEQVEKRICIEFCVKLEHSSLETIHVIYKATAMGNLVIGSFITKIPTHTSCLMQVFFVKHKITQVTQAPCNFWLFPKLKSPLKGKRFQTVHEIQENTTGQLMAIPAKDFAECFE